MAKNLPDIVYILEDNNPKKPVIDSANSIYQIPMFKDASYFSNIQSYVSFIKSCERLIRTNDRYKKYIRHVKTKIGITHCQVLSNIEPDEDGKIAIEMHHGPIFTLYDYCEIMIEYFMIKGMKISTFRIADAILEEHQQNRIQVMMLLATIHEEVHNRNIFLHHEQAFGDLHAFVKKYGIAINDGLREKMNRYIDRCIIQDSDDFKMLELNNLLFKY